MVKNVKKIISFLCGAIFCTAIAIGMPQIAMAAEVTIDETNFPDELFRNYVSSNFDKNKDNLLSAEEIVNVKSIHFSGATNAITGIKNLKGIEYFTALTKLDCGFSQLAALDLSKNTALTTLYCGHNQLAALDLSNNTVLTTLHCDDNQLAALDLSKNIALTDLHCGRNKLAALNISKNTALEILDCPSNQMTALDLSKNTALTTLYCDHNQMAALDVSNNTALKVLDCSGNQIAVLNVIKNTNLKILYCPSNQITDLDLSNNTALTDLYCFYNKLAELKLNSQTYDKLLLYKGYLHGDVILSGLQNITETATNNSNTVSLLKVTDITKPAIYKVEGKDFTIMYVNDVIMPSPSTSPSSKPGVLPSDIHIFNDYTYTTPVSSPAVIYGNGINKKINNKTLTVYTDILASYKYTPNSNGTVKSAAGKVIVAVTKTNVKPELNSRNKVTDTSASKIAKAKIKNGQITVTAVGKEGSLVYLWVIDTGGKGISTYYPIEVKLAPKKLEVQGTTGTKLTNTKLENGKPLDVHITGLAGSVKTEDCTYTPVIESKYQPYVQITPQGSAGQDFRITATGLKKDKDTNVKITFTCDQNSKKVKFPLTITK